MSQGSPLGAVAEARPAFDWPEAALPPAPEAAPLDPDLAVRARLNAILLDGVILAVATAVLVGALGTTARSPDALLLVLGLQFIYFFALEAATGQTVGKRAFHVRVVALDGTPLSTRQSAIRNVLRFIDAVPILYASGLLSMIRTGRRRRQRIGDVAAGTIVVVEPTGRPLRTPGWLLPVVTLLATLASVGILVAVLDAPTTAQIPPVAGFTGNTSARPAAGNWQATGTTTRSIGYSDDPIGAQTSGAWVIVRSCTSSDQCSFALTRQVAGQSVTAPLILQADGWHAMFPLIAFSCGFAGGQTIYWQEQSSWVLRFSNAGRAAQANERNFSSAPGCGYGTDTVAWSATHG